MAVSMAALLPAILVLLLSHGQSQDIIPQNGGQAYSSRSRQNHLFVSEFQETKVKIAQLESSLEKSIQDLNVRSIKLEETENLIEEISHEIDSLQSSLLGLKDDSSDMDERLSALEEEVRVLWTVSRKNNFELHTLESKAQDADKRLEVVSLEVEKISDIVTEQWIQIQQLEQALQIAEMNAVKQRRQLGSRRCTFIKFIKNLYGNHVEKLRGMLAPYLHGECVSSYLSQSFHQLERTLSAAKHYHHQLQGVVKHEMERNGFTTAFANNEVVFFVASAIIIFPIMTAWMFLVSQLG